MIRPSPVVLSAFRASTRVAAPKSLAHQKAVTQPHLGSMYVGMYVSADNAVRRSTLSSAFLQEAGANSRWVPSLFFWGFTGGVTVSLFMSGVPLFQQDVLSKSPLVRILNYVRTMADTRVFMCYATVRH